MKSRPSKDQPTVNEDDIDVTQSVVEKEILEDLDIKIKKLMRNQPPIAIDFHAFKDEYGLLNEGINPHRIKNKMSKRLNSKKRLGQLEEGVVTLLLIVIMFKWWIESRRFI
jgi:hypothetical protein